MGNVLSKRTLDYIVEPTFFDGPDAFTGSKRTMKLGFNFERVKGVMLDK